MSKKAIVVIGAGYGDEGKGLMTDYFCRSAPSNPLVIRFNGGAQAGHTVVTEDGRRHVFSHFGSGEFAGARTYLSDDFIVNPIKFREEYNTLYSKHVRPITYISENCRITTPYDMILNQCIETCRSNRHGSCGLGIFTTIQRHNDISVTINDLQKMDYNEVKSFLREVQHYSKLKAKQHDVAGSFDEYFNMEFHQKFYADISMMLDNAYCAVNDHDIPIEMIEHFVFEGAQGLLLNEKYGVAPHLTPSDTGCTTPLNICSWNDIEVVDICYTTRIYATRHGAGDLTNETTAEHLGLRNIENETNVKNEYQGSFRYGHLNTRLISDVINKDYEINEIHHLNTRKLLAITCIDQIDENLPVWNNQMLLLDTFVNPTLTFESRGPTASTIKVR